MKTFQKPGIWLGGLVGGLLTAPLMALLYLGDQLAGLPFIPFDVFDWTARILPGGIITFGIDTMVSIIDVFNLGETSSAAKTAEIILGLATFLLLGVVAGIIFFALMRRSDDPQRLDHMPGIVLGLVAVIPLLIISNSVNASATADPLISVVWLVIVFLGWGVAISWIYRDLISLPSSGDKQQDAEEGVYVQSLNRRQFLVRIGGVTATLTVIGAGVSALIGNSRRELADPQVVSDLPVGDTPTDGQGNTLPNTAEDNLQAAPGTRPEYTPLDDHYRIDISARPPVVNESTWRLPVTGLVDNPVELSLSDIRNDFEPLHQFITLSCISNRIAGDLISTTKWSGIRMQDFLDLVQPQAGAVAIKITGADGFDEFVMLDDISNDDRVMLAYAWDDVPLKQKHGFPLRIYIPNRYGMKQPKWIVSMEFVDAWEEGYWVRRGWSKEAMVNTVSVVDTVAVDSVLLVDEETFIVPIGGIAYAGADGISKVEISVNDGDWEEAQLRSPLSDLTWVIWRYDWTYEEGDYTFAVRSYNGDGELQPTHSQSTRPDGATGVHSKAMTMPSMADVKATANEA